MDHTLHGTEGHRAQLRALTETRIPSRQDVDEAVGNLRSAITDAARQLDDSLLGEDRRTALLQQALEFHYRHGDDSCPVCGDGFLDEEWSQRVLAQLAENADRLAAARRARNAVRHHGQEIRDIVARVPAFTAPTDAGLSTLPRAQAAHTRWAKLPEDDSALADHVAAAYTELADSVSTLRAEAAELLAAHEGAWTPLAA